MHPSSFNSPGKKGIVYVQLLQVPILTTKNNVESKGNHHRENMPLMFSEILACL